MQDSTKLLDKAIIYATHKHSGQLRKISHAPYILHPLEVAHILSTMTDDTEVISAGLLHDVVEGTDTSLEEIRKEFGDRVAALVASETEAKSKNDDKSATWKKRKEDSIKYLRQNQDIDVKRLWLADKLSNIRSMVNYYNILGHDLWSNFHQSDPQMHRWYYNSIAEILELDLNRTAAYKEFVYNINYLWPGTIASYKERYQKFKEYKLDGCELIGKGAKGDVYRYNDELVIKLYNKNNTYKDIERENKLAKKAFIAGLPTAISFGIVSVGANYGAMYELLDVSTISQKIAKQPSSLEHYAQIMARLALNIHQISTEDWDLPDYREEVKAWIDQGLGLFDTELAKQVHEILDKLPKGKSLIHGDFHAANVMIQGDEPMLIDLDRLSSGNPILELITLHMTYLGFYETDRETSCKFNNFDEKIALSFYEAFVSEYFKDWDLAEKDKALNLIALLDYCRLLRRVYKKGSDLSEKDQEKRAFILDKIKYYLDLSCEKK